MLRKNNEGDTSQQKARSKSPLRLLVIGLSELDATGQQRAVYSDPDLLEIAKQKLSECAGYEVKAVTKARGREGIMPYQS